MNELQQQINDLVSGKHKDWHLQGVKTSTYGPLGREWISEQYWEFIAGFDYESDAREAQASCERTMQDALQYGGDEVEFRVVKREGA